MKFTVFNDYDLSVLIYYLTSENKNGKINNINEIKEKIYNKMSILLPEEQILILSEDNPLKKK